MPVSHFRLRGGKLPLELRAFGHGVRAGSERNGIQLELQTSQGLQIAAYSSGDVWDRTDESRVFCAFYQRHLEVEGEPCSEAGNGLMDPKDRAGGPSVSTRRRGVYRHQGDCR